MTAYFHRGGPLTFAFDSSRPPTPPTTEDQNKKLRNIALDNLAKELESIQQSANRHSRELDDLADRASRTATQLRQLRPLLPAGDNTGKKSKKR